MSKDKEQGEQSQELAVMTPAIRERFEVLLADVPEADAEEATISIVTAIVGAEDPDDLDAPWAGQGMRKLIGRLLRVDSIKRLPSDFADGPGWYLGCDCLIEASGEKLFVTTGSLPILAQLATAYVKGWLPLSVVVRQSERPSRNGYFPMHLEIDRGAR